MGTLYLKENAKEIKQYKKLGVECAAEAAKCWAQHALIASWGNVMVWYGRVVHGIRDSGAQLGGSVCAGVLISSKRIDSQSVSQSSGSATTSSNSEPASRLFIEGRLAVES